MSRHLPLLEELVERQLAAWARPREAAECRLFVSHVRGRAHAIQKLRLNARVAKSGQVEEGLYEQAPRLHGK